MPINDTIAAPATAITTQALAVIRISGRHAFRVIDKLLTKKIPHKRGVYFRSLYDGKELVDDVVIAAFVGPKSFTGEDVIEVSCHGGILNTRRILQLILASGARLALNGEFSQRAFLNNKINLIQAEGINDLINATNNLSLKIGAANMHGENLSLIKKIKSILLDLISRIQVTIDYPEYDTTEELKATRIEDDLKELLSIIQKFLSRSLQAQRATSGQKTVIIGEPNVGKSSILNRLIDEEKAIVTDIPGTTRDIVEGQVHLNGLTLNLIDTAGLRKTADKIEQLGILKSKASLKAAELVFLITTPNGLEKLNDLDLKKLLKGKRVIKIVNKSDQLSEYRKAQIKKQYPEVIFTSALNGDITELISTLETKFNLGELFQNDELTLISDSQIALLQQLKSEIQGALTCYEEGMPIDILNVNLYGA